jgi:hypothetical protein
MSEQSTFAQRNPKSGLIEIIDMYTGGVVAVQREPLDLLTGHKELMVEMTLPTGEKIYMQKGIDPGLVVHTKSMPFNQNTVDLICQKVAEGQSLTSICKEPGFPSYSQLAVWKRSHIHIIRQLEEARRERAEYYRDQALAEAQTAESTKDPINASSLRVDTYKWAAGMDDAKYQAKTKMEATINQPVQIIVNTGIVREVSNDPNEKQVAPALPDSSGGAATANENNDATNRGEVHPVRGSAIESGDGVPC